MYSALLTAIVLWISANTGISANYDHPDIKFVPADQIALLRQQAFTSTHQSQVPSLQQQSKAVGVSNAREAIAVYDDQSDTIFLLDSWQGNTPGDLSVLVHEMVHHLQNKGHLKYECQGAREEPAYAAQEKWLSLFGSNLSSEFQIDGFTLKVSTMCGY